MNGQTSPRLALISVTRRSAPIDGPAPRALPVNRRSYERRLSPPPQPGDPHYPRAGQPRQLHGQHERPAAHRARGRSDPHRRSSRHGAPLEDRACWQRHPGLGLGHPDRVEPRPRRSSGDPMDRGGVEPISSLPVSRAWSSRTGCTRGTCSDRRRQATASQRSHSYRMPNRLRAPKALLRSGEALLPSTACKVRRRPGKLSGCEPRRATTETLWRSPGSTTSTASERRFETVPRASSRHAPPKDAGD